MKLWVWAYAAGKGNLLEAGTDPLTVIRIKRRSLAVPLACIVAILLALINVRLAPFGFILIPPIARLLDTTRKAEGASDKASDIGDTEGEAAA